jgi:hypothetical protein
LQTTAPTFNGSAVREYLPNGALAALALGVRCNEALDAEEFIRPCLACG